MGVVIKRLVQLGVNSGFKMTLTKINVGFSPTFSLVSKLQSPYDYSGYRRHLSHIVNPNGIVDTLAVVRSLEAKGVPSKKAEAITYALTEVLSDSLEHVYDTYVSHADMQKTMMPHLSKFVRSFPVKNLESLGVSSNKAEIISLPTVQVLNNDLETISDKFVSKVEMQKNVKLQKAIFSTFKCEIKGLEERHFLKLEHENSKLRNYLEKMNSDLTRKIDHGIHGLKAQLDEQNDDMKAQLETAKLDVLKYYVGMLVSVPAAILAIICLWC